MSIPNPVGKQLEVLGLPDKGQYIVLGTAGSGKTTLAILRSEYLARLCEKNERVLLVTFNKALVTYLNAIAEKKLKNVHVRNYHKFARGYLKSRGLMGYNDIVSTNDYGDNKKLTYVGIAIQNIIDKIGKNSTLSRSKEVFYEEINWIQKMGMNSLPEYLEAERIGRSGTRITRENRKYFYEVFEEYIRIRKDAGYRYDWDDLAYYVNKELENDTSLRMYKHIIIDEGQDFSPIMLQSLVKAIPGDGSITFFGDVAQQIYGGRISWRYAGLKVTAENMWKFEQNYRNTREIAELAIAISRHPSFKNDADLVIPKYPIASGPLPAIVEVENENNEVEFILDRAIDIAESETVAILLRDRETVRNIISNLTKKGVFCQELKGEMTYWNSEPGISVGTYHSAKGLEFNAVLMPFCNSQRLPDESRLLALEDRAEALSEEIKLIYVGVTRAKRTLIISFTGEMTELIPEDDKLYQKF